ncbi:hypothetical protein [Pseudoalteromonas luteoviolacea]|uniref:Uncharacterized protein n=1 Tax=Pseudoalteromonas luteoviolacea (strain 2ta16) TaxID=1353533 RepID=V4I381_PSEL2|nr:hypothetical protein [Pseudoalteromonas luteoviolacea]ESP94694.1 hypothetical protein PL2TA16_00694 [Pseudoalteromonas luteoviolacea 2ta16]KZN43442.1 hypothetical protein N483_09100 [Pseudoalteromonas luteoviolacea NCIMB 1944]
MARKIDFSTYSLNDLYLSARAIDRDKYPERAKEIDRLIAEKEESNPDAHMKKISFSTYHNNAIYNMIMFVFFVLIPAIFTSVFLFNGSMSLIFAPIFTIVYGFTFFKFCRLDVPDAVYDDGDALLFINNNKQRRVELKEIVKVRHEMWFRHLIRLEVRAEGASESECLFMPDTNSKLFSVNPIVCELNKRANAARRAKQSECKRQR